MAFRTGTRVDPRLMEIDYSPSIRASEIMGATIGGIGSTIGKAITTRAEKEKEKKAALSYIDVIERNFITEGKPEHPWAKFGKSIRPQTKINPATGLPLKVTSDMLTNLREGVETGDISLATVMSITDVVLEQKNIEDRQKTTTAAATLEYERRRSLQQMGIDARNKANELTETEVLTARAGLRGTELRVEVLETELENQEKYNEIRGAFNPDWATIENGWEENTGFAGNYFAWRSFKDRMINREAGEKVKWLNPMDGVWHTINTMNDRDKLYKKLVKNLENETRKLNSASEFSTRLSGAFKSLMKEGLYFETEDVFLREGDLGEKIYEKKVLYPWSDIGSAQYESEMTWKDPSPKTDPDSGQQYSGGQGFPAGYERGFSMPRVGEEKVNIQTPTLPQRATGGAAKPDYSLPPTSFETQRLPQVQPVVQPVVQPPVQPAVQPAVQPHIWNKSTTRSLTPSEVFLRRGWAKAAEAVKGVAEAVKGRQENFAIATDLINLIKEPGLPDISIIEELKALPQEHQNRVINSILNKGVKELLEVTGNDPSGTTFNINKKQLKAILEG